MIRIISVFTMVVLLVHPGRTSAQYTKQDIPQIEASTYFMKTPSIKSRIYRIALRLAGMKTKIRKLVDSGAFEAVQPAAPIPSETRETCEVRTRQTSGNRTVWEIRPKDSEPDRYLFFLHGGAFVANITSYDWKLLTRLVINTKASIIIPDYPLTPKHNVQDVLDMIVPEYRALVESKGAENIILAGFSAGGGIALTLAEHAQIHHLQQPSQIILLSPLLDATFSHPDIPEIDKVDPYLDLPGLKLAVKAYAAGIELTDYRISPLYGPLEKLAPVHLFIGTHEIFWPDPKKLKARAEEKGLHLTYYEYHHMYHGWLFLNMPEARDAFDKLVEIIKQ